MKIRVWIFNEIKNNFCLFNNLLSIIFNLVFLFVSVFCHLGYTFLMPVLIDKSISSHVNILLLQLIACRLIYIIYDNMSYQIYPFIMSWKKKKINK